MGPSHCRGRGMIPRYPASSVLSRFREIEILSNVRLSSLEQLISHSVQNVQLWRAQTKIEVAKVCRDFLNTNLDSKSSNCIRIWHLESYKTTLNSKQSTVDFNSDKKTARKGGHQSQFQVLRHTDFKQVQTHRHECHANEHGRNSLPATCVLQS